MRQWIEETRLCRSSGIAILLETHGKALADLGVACEEIQEYGAGNLGHADSCNRSDRHRTAIAEQIKSTCKIVSTLAIGDDTLIRLVTARSCCSAASYLHKAFQQDMHRLALWSSWS